MKIYDINDFKHFSTRLGLILIVYCLLFLFGFIIDSGEGCLGPISLVTPILIGTPLVVVLLLIDLFILWYKKEFTVKKVLINFLVLALFFGVITLGYSVLM